MEIIEVGVHCIVQVVCSDHLGTVEVPCINVPVLMPFNFGTLTNDSIAISQVFITSRPYKAFERTCCLAEISCGGQDGYHQLYTLAALL